MALLSQSGDLRVLGFACSAVAPIAVSKARQPARSAVNQSVFLRVRFIAYGLILRMARHASTERLCGRTNWEKQAETTGVASTGRILGPPGLNAYSLGTPDLSGRACCNEACCRIN